MTAGGEFDPQALGAEVTALRELLELNERTAHEQAVQLESTIAELAFKSGLLEFQQESMDDGILVVSSKGKVLSANQRLADMFSIPASSIAVSEDGEILRRILTILSDTTLGVSVLPPIETISENQELLVHLADGRFLEVGTSAFDVPGDERPGRGWYFRDITQRQQAEQQAQAARERSEFLLRAAVTLSSSLDYETTLRQVAQLVVPKIADWCAIDLVEANGRVRRVSVENADPRKKVVMDELQERFPPLERDDSGILKVIRTGVLEYHREIPEELLRRAAEHERHFKLLKDLGLRSAVVAPLKARGRILGAITFVSAESGRTFGQDDVTFVEDIAARAAIAVDNARLFTERSEVASALQRSLLPPALPKIDGLELGARYVSGEYEIPVGGDFYDVFPISKHDWGLVMGDVCGKGAEAATMTAVARYSIRTAAMMARRPAAVLARLNEALLQYGHEERFCTAAYLRVQTRKGVLVRAACGGHPLPLILRKNGSINQAGVPGMLLGAFEHVDHREQMLRLDPGDSVVLFTDGATEARGSVGELGEEGLSDALAGCKGLEAQDIADNLTQTVLEFQNGHSRDDVAFLVARVST